MRVIGAITATTVNLRASDSVWRESAPVLPVPPGKAKVRQKTGGRETEKGSKERKRKKKRKREKNIQEE